MYRGTTMLRTRWSVSNYMSSEGVKIKRIKNSADIFHLQIFSITLEQIKQKEEMWDLSSYFGVRGVPKLSEIPSLFSVILDQLCQWFKVRAQVCVYAKLMVSGTTWITPGGERQLSGYIQEYSAGPFCAGIKLRLPLCTSYAFMSALSL